MTVDKLAVVARLEASGSPDMIKLAKSFVMADDTRPVSDKVIRIKVAEASRLWETRLQNTKITKRSIVGADNLVRRLRTLDPNSFIEQFGFINSRQGGNLFFGDQNGGFIGLVVADRPNGRKLPFV